MHRHSTLLIGNFGAGNLGDESILYAALDVYPEAKVMTLDAERSQKFCGRSFSVVAPFPTGIRSFFRYCFDREYRVTLMDGLKEIEQVVFVGGGLFAIRLWAYFVWWSMAGWVRRLCPQAEIIWEYQGIDRTKNVIKKWMLSRAFRDAKRISVRDKESFNFVQKMCSTKITQEPDRVDGFLQDRYFQSTAGNGERGLVLIQARAPIGADVMARVVEAYGGYAIGFVAFDEGDLRYCPKEADFCAYPAKYQELVDLIASADVFLGERLHSIVYGYRILGQKKVRLLREPYSQKVAHYASKHSIECF